MEPSLATNSVSDSSTNVDQDARPQVASQTTNLARGRRILWPILCFLQLGLLIGGYVVYRRTSAELAPQSEEPTVPSAHRKAPSVDVLTPPRSSSAQDDLERGDRWIRSGRFDLALPLFRAFGPDMTASLRELVSYRIALCLEGLGHWDEAAAAYRALLTQSRNLRAQGAAQVGQARLAFHHGRPEEIKELMTRMLLRSAEYSKHCPAALEDAKYLLALALTREAAMQTASMDTLEQMAEPASITWPVERSLGWVDPPSEVEPRATKLAQELGVALQKIQARPEESFFRASMAHAAVHPLLDQLASGCGFKSQWTARAAQQAEAHQVDIQVENIPFLELASHLVGPFHLAWRIQDGVVYWLAVEELSPQELIAFRSGLARRALQDAATAYPRHDLAATASLYLGNLEVRAGQAQAGIARYERIIQAPERSPVLVEANFNLGLVQHRMGDDVTARKAFYRVVDLAPGHELAPLAYLAVGRTWLNEGQPARAISPLRRALSVGAGSPVQPVLAVTLAASYLWEGNPQAAHSILFAHRAQVSQPPHRRLAAFLDALSRFQAAAGRRVTQHANDLLAAMISVGEESYLKSLGVLLVGQAYRELGMVDQLIVVYEPQLHQARGAVAEEMSYSLAEAYAVMGKSDEAKRLLLALAIQENSRWAVPAKFRLAELARKENRSKEALLWYRQLLLIQPPENLPVLLQLMGKAFEQNGEDEQAARCFRGEKPT